MRSNCSYVLTLAIRIAANFHGLERQCDPVTALMGCCEPRSSTQHFCGYPFVTQLRLDMPSIKRNDHSAKMIYTCAWLI